MKKRAAICWPVRFFDFVCRQCQFQAPRRLDGGQDPQSPCPGTRLCSIIDSEFALDITGVGLDRVQREEKPGSDSLIGPPFGDELEYF
jgi:hypothetical protein